MGSPGVAWTPVERKGNSASRLRQISEKDLRRLLNGMQGKHRCCCVGYSPASHCSATLAIDFKKGHFWLKGVDCSGMFRRKGKTYQRGLTEPDLPKVSIIIANYEKAEALEETIKSIVVQTYHNLELIIIDNASKDISVEVIKKYENHITHWVSESDKGIYDAFNKGIKMSSGEWVYFLGSGDKLVGHDVIARIFSVREDVDLIYGNVYFHHYGSVYAGKFSKRRLLDVNICQQGIFYHRRLFDRLGMFDTKYPLLADWVFNMRCFGDKRVRTRFVDKVIAFYELGGASTIKKDANFWQEREILIRRYLGISCWAYFMIKYRLYFKILGIARRSYRLARTV
jgi:glycosyltransferase involved in cell wall biosynthesis